MQKSNFKRLVRLALVGTFSSLLLASCASPSVNIGSEGSVSDKAPPSPQLSDTEDLKMPEITQNPVVVIEVADFGNITVELRPDKAPNTVCSFLSLVQKDFYNGVIFHRIIQNFMIQGGDPTGSGTGGPGYNIPGEFPGNGFTQNDLKHVRGAISMARSQLPDSAGSQFFICDTDDDFLNGEYCPFGMVTEGMDVVDKIAAVKTTGGDENRPIGTPPTIVSIKADTFGVEYPQPKIS